MKNYISSIIIILVVFALQTGCKEDLQSIQNQKKEIEKAKSEFEKIALENESLLIKVKQIEKNQFDTKILKTKIKESKKIQDSRVKRFQAELQRLKENIVALKSSNTQQKIILEKNMKKVDALTKNIKDKDLLIAQFDKNIKSVESQLQIYKENSAIFKSEDVKEKNRLIKELLKDQKQSQEIIKNLNSEIKKLEKKLTESIKTEF